MTRYAHVSAYRAHAGGPPVQPSPREKCERCHRQRVIWKWQYRSSDAPQRLCGACRHEAFLEAQVKEG